MGDKEDQMSLKDSIKIQKAMSNGPQPPSPKTAKPEAQYHDKASDTSAEDKGDKSTDKISESRATAITNGHTKISKNDSAQADDVSLSDKDGAAEATPSSSATKKRAHADDTSDVADKKLKDGNPADAIEDTAKVNQTEHPTECPETGEGLLERGHIYFFYRPRVGLEVAKSLDDVQRFHFLLAPLPAGHPHQAKYSTTPSKMTYRLINVGKKRMPEIAAKEVMWSCVSQCGQNLDELESMGSQQYGTKTQGSRNQGASRVAGRGSYSLVSRGRNAILAYILEVPEEVEEVQDALGIRKQGSYILQVKNPETGGPANASLSEDARVNYPESFMSHFQGRRWNAANPPQFLDFAGVEMLLVSGSEDMKAQTGEEGEKLEKNSAQEEKTADYKDVFEELRMDFKDFPAKALHGDWV